MVERPIEPTYRRSMSAESPSAARSAAQQAQIQVNGLYGDRHRHAAPFLFRRKFNSQNDWMRLAARSTCHPAAIRRSSQHVSRAVSPNQGSGDRAAEPVRCAETSMSGAVSFGTLTRAALSSVKFTVASTAVLSGPLMRIGTVMPLPG